MYAFSSDWATDGRLDLFDVALMNDYLDMKADNEARLARWREDQ
ncbi:DUF6889 family protein [Serratia marcescens]|nr:hypothetical protein [Serratia marcescens]